MWPERVSVVGAGPAGLAAAIELARNGVDVVVYEQRSEVGRRFHGDFQGLENWTTEDDVGVWLARLGIAMDFPHRPIESITLVTPELEPYRVRDDRPLLYLVRRGPQSDTLDQGLKTQSERLGVRICFERRVSPATHSGPIIWATGPTTTQAVVAGVLAKTSHPDQVLAIACNALAPRCYAYCVIWNGRATLATALATRFGDAWRCFERARQAFARLGLSDFRDECRFGGRANIAVGRRFQRGEEFWVGEAAGLQDYLLGFGLRYAILSGHLAARALLAGTSYRELLERHLGRQFRAGLANRLLYNRAGDRGYRYLIRWVSRATSVRSLARRVYAMTPFHRVIYPLAWVAAPRAGALMGNRGERRAAS